MAVSLEMTVVIPCYNEAGNLEELVRACVSASSKTSGLFFLLVDNGSVDDTPKILPSLVAGEPCLRIYRVPENKGYGFGILEGLKQVETPLTGWMHADLQTTPDVVIEAVSLFRSSPAPEKLFVKGSRFGRSFRDVVFTWGMSAFETVLMRMRLNDINGQPTLFHRSFLDSWEDPPTDFSLDLFAYVSGIRAGLNVRKMPAHFGVRYSGEGHNDRISAKLRLSYRTIGYSLRLRQRLKL